MPRRYLQKQSHGALKRWQNRYFELTRDNLKYFESAFPRNRDTLRGVIGVDQIVKHFAEEDPTEFTLDLVGSKVFKMKARTGKHAARWNDALGRLLKNSSGELGNSAGIADAQPRFKLDDDGTDRKDASSLSSRYDTWRKSSKTILGRKNSRGNLRAKEQVWTNEIDSLHISPCWPILSAVRILGCAWQSRFSADS